MSLKTIAELANVSVSTVSKAFSGSAEVSEETKNLIFDIAKKNGYFDKYNKNKFDKKVIGVIVPEFNSNYYANILLLLNEEIKNRGGIMTVSENNFSAKTTEEIFRYYSGYCNIDGIIIIDSSEGINNSLRIPAVSLGRVKLGQNIDTIKQNSLHGIKEAVKYLKNNGHTKIYFADEKLTSVKQKQFVKAMEEAGVNVTAKHMRVSSKRFEEAGYEIAEKLIAENNLPTAIIAAYDNIAIGIIKALSNHGYKVPEDVSVIGYDDIGVTPYLETSLTSIKTNGEVRCKKAVELVFKKIKNQHISLEDYDTELNSQLVIRASTGKAKK